MIEPKSKSQLARMTAQGYGSATPKLPWEEKVPMLSINPDAATREDVAQLAADLMKANCELAEANRRLAEAVKLLKKAQPFVMADAERTEDTKLEQLADRINAAILSSKTEKK